MSLGRPLFKFIRRFTGALREIMSDSKDLTGLVMVFSIAFIGFTAPYLSIASYDSIDFPKIPSPSPKHLLITDHLGRDLLSRAIWRARVSLMVRFVAAGTAALIGILLGTMARYFGGLLYAVIRRITDVFFVIPILYSSYSCSSLWEQHSIDHVNNRANNMTSYS